MTKRLFVVTALVVLACLFLSPSAPAQSSGCLSLLIWFPLVDGPFPPGFFFYSIGEGPFSIFIASWNATCASPAGPTETRSKCPYCGKPISLATGNTYIEQTDVSLPGLGGGLKLERTWNSMWPTTQSLDQVGFFGPNWRSTFEERVFTGSDGTMKYARSDGSYWSFSVLNPGTLLAPSNTTATLSQGASYWTITFQNGEQRRFDNQSGSLITIADRNGNLTSIAHDATNRITTVTDPTGRHLTFNYPNSSSRLVSSLTSDFGVSLSYTYDASNRLSTVTFQDGSTNTFSYDANSLITSITDSQGKVLEAHTYDSKGRGLTVSQANGVNAVTLSYPQ